MILYFTIHLHLFLINKFEFVYNPLEFAPEVHTLIYKMAGCSQAKSKPDSPLLRLKRKIEN